MKHKVEAFDIWMYLQYIINYEPLIRCRIDFADKIDVETLKNAVTASLKAIPILGCTFQGEGSRPLWTERGFTGEDMVHEVTAAGSAIETVHQCLSARINIAEEPLLKIYLIRKPTCDTLCVIISHLICDAAGFKTYLYLLSDCYTKLALHMPLSLPNLGTRGVKPLFKGIRLNERIRYLLSLYDAYESAVNSDEEGVSHPNSGKNEAYFENLVITKESFLRLKNFANKNDATLNDALMSLYALAFCRVMGKERIFLPSTLDLRKYLPEGYNAGITNYSNNCMCDISVRDGDSLVDIMRQVSAQMKVHKSNNDVIRATMRWNTLVHLMSFSQLKRQFDKIIAEPVVSFSNLATLEKQRLSFASTVIDDAYMTGAIRPRPYLQLTASTWDDHCTLCCNIYGCDDDRAVVRRIMDHIDAEVAAVAATLDQR